MISTVFISSENGSILISQTYRNDAVPNCMHEFINLVQYSNKQNGFLAPEQEWNKLWYYHIKRNSLYIVAVSAVKQSPFLIIELLSKLFSLCKDFCGTFTEDSVKANFILIQELLMDFMKQGYPQLCSTEKLKPYIYSEPAVLKHKTPIRELVQSGLLGLEKQELSSQAANKPIISSRKGGGVEKNEIFLDVIEYLSVLINKDGTVLRSDVSGQLLMKSFLSGNPEVRIRLNEDLNIDSSNSSFGNSVHLDSYSFHESVNQESFTTHRTLIAHPPPGEFIVATYRIESSPLAFLPLRLIYSIDDKSSSRDLDLILTLRCQMPVSAKALHVLAHLPVPKSTTSVMSQLAGPSQTTEFDSNHKKVLWKIQNFSGSTEAVAKLKLVSGNVSGGRLLELGPLALEFELSSFVCSGLNIRFLQVQDHKNQASDPAAHHRCPLVSINDCDVHGPKHRLRIPKCTVCLPCKNQTVRR